MADRPILFSAAMAAALADLIDKVNGTEAWEANPWVAVYGFRVERANIGELS